MASGDPPREGSELRDFLARIRAGDEEAARELLRRYESQVRLVVRRQLPRLLRSRFESLDFVQSVWGSFIRRMRAVPSELEDPRNLIVFLARSAKNKVIDEYRRALSQKQDMRLEESLWEGERPRDLIAVEDTPSEIAEARETYRRLQDLLPEKRRSILELKAEGLSNREVGRRLMISERTVRRVIEDLRRRTPGPGEESTDGRR